MSSRCFGQRSFKSGAKSKNLRMKLAKRDGLNCQICHKPLPKTYYRVNIEIDHIVPWARGGSTVISNLRLAHRKCNHKRGAPTYGELLTDENVDFDEDDYIFNSDESRNNGFNRVVIQQVATRMGVDMRKKKSSSVVCSIKGCKRKLELSYERRLIEVDSPMDDLSEGQLAEYMAAEEGDLVLKKVRRVVW